MALFGRRQQPTGIDPVELELEAWQIRGKESPYGYAVAIELIFVAILQLTIKGGKGAPAHPSWTVMWVGLATSVGQLLLLRTRNRTFVSLGTILAALIVDLPNVPDRLRLAKAFALIIPIVYALVLFRRRTKSERIRKAAGLPVGPRRGGTEPSSTTRRASRTPGGRRGVQSSRSGRSAARSGRYTPPKPKATKESGRRS